MMLAPESHIGRSALQCAGCCLSSEVCHLCADRSLPAQLCPQLCARADPATGQPHFCSLSEGGPAPAGMSRGGWHT